MTNSNDPRLRQDDRERKDKENSNAGMIGGVIIALLALLAIYFSYDYLTRPEPAPLSSVSTVPADNNATTATPAAAPAAPANTSNQ